MKDYSIIKLTAEEKKVLKANADHLITAYRHDYTLPLFQKDKLALGDIYNKYVTKKSINYGCPRCILGLLKGLYPLAEAQGIITKK